MEPLRIGLVGFGRLGRNLFRILADQPDLELVAISDKIDLASLAYLLRFDTLLGRFPRPIHPGDGFLDVDGRRLRVLPGGEPASLPWRELGVDVVVEEGKAGRTRAEFAGHLEAGARRVIVCVPTSGRVDLTVVRGVNDEQLQAAHRIVSPGSSSAQAAAPVLKVLSDAFGLERAFLTTVHAYSDQQRLADVPADDYRRGRAAAENIVPQPTNAAEVLVELLPELAGKLHALSLNVPLANGSVVDLVSWHSKEVSREAINQALADAAAKPRYQGVLAYESEPIVSSDVLRSSYSSNFDSLATMTLAGRVAKTLAWFDNGWGYAHRVLELARRLRQLDEEAPR